MCMLQCHAVVSDLDKCQPSSFSSFSSSPSLPLHPFITPQNIILLSFPYYPLPPSLPPSLSPYFIHYSARTHRAMGGAVPFEIALSARLDIIRPSLTQVEACSRKGLFLIEIYYPQAISSSPPSSLLAVILLPLLSLLV